MKRFTKTALILSGVAAGIGVICMVVSIIMGMTKDGFIHMVEDGRFSFRFGRNNAIHIFDFDDEPEDMKDGTVTIDEVGEGVLNIDLEYAGGKLEICYGDVENIQLEKKNAAGISWSYEEDTLHIVEKETVFSDYADVSLKIILPENTTYGEINLEIGASQATIDGITADEIDIIVGAGQANITNLHAKEVGLEVGAGEANVTNLNVENLDMEVGVGQVDVQVCGAESDYNYNVECGIGSVKIGDNSYDGLGAEFNSAHHNDNNHTDRLIDIECGIGEVVVKFTE